jgi:response regulator RpfG family c-di-GMP phosphodiesterase
MNILVGLIEMPRKDFRGHSAQVARQSGLIARRMGMTPRDVSYTSIAAYLHDLGKRPDKHFTLASLAMTPDAKVEAKRYVRAPIKLFETVHLHGAVNTILAQLYEAYDGTGIPQGVKGDDIAMGSRIIAAVDAFFDLTRNPFNPFGRVLPKAEALDWLREQAGKLFDAVVVDTLSTLQSGDLLKQRLENDGRQVFVADPDEATRTDLMDALSKQGVVAQAVLKLDSVIDAVLSGEADTIAVGLAFGLNDLLALIQFVRARPESASLPVLVLGDPTDAQSKEKLVQSGATGFVPLPLNPDEAATAILATYTDRVQHGGPGHQVRGSFDEFSPAELARLLGGSRKSGRLNVRNGPNEGFCVFERGRIVYAAWTDKKGDQALTALFSQPQAEFQYDPEAVLSDMPNIEKDLDVLARQLGSAAPVQPT